MKKPIFIIIVICFSFQLFGRSFPLDSIATKPIEAYTYEWAYLQYVDMLEAKIPLDFKKAVFVYENTYLEGKLSYDEFSNHFVKIAKKLKEFINNKGISQFKTARQYAIFSYMFEPSTLNNKQVFKYDFKDFMGDSLWTNMFVSKVIDTKTGNCHSLPYYYKILANELKAEVFLALGPNHLYIKHLDEKGKWVNIELTNGHIASDAWIISSLGISAEAIKKGIYMDALSEKESIALCLLDLASSYQKKNGLDEFVLKCSNTVLLYFPNNIQALLIKNNCLVELCKKASNEELKKDYIIVLKEIDTKLKDLGYRELPEKASDEWVKKPVE